MSQAVELNPISTCSEIKLGEFKFRVFDLVAFLTAYSLFRISHLPLDMGLAIGSAVLVCWSTVRKSPWFWLGIAAVWLPRMYANFEHYEDHCFFTVYWCAAMGLACLGKRCDFSMGQTARILIGLCFAFGLVWKIISPEFYESSLFHFKLLFDYRFEEMVTNPVGGLSTMASTLNLEAYQSVRMQTPGSDATLIIPTRVTWLAYTMTAWTIVIEGLIAWAFLFSGKLAERSRDLVLMFFMMSTYFVVPVMGFASIFMTLGIAQTKSKKAIIAYLVTHAILFVWFSIRLAA